MNCCGLATPLLTETMFAGSTVVVAVLDVVVVVVVIMVVVVELPTDTVNVQLDTAHAVPLTLLQKARATQ